MNKKYLWAPYQLMPFYIFAAFFTSVLVVSSADLYRSALEIKVTILSEVVILVCLLIIVLNLFKNKVGKGFAWGLHIIFSLIEIAVLGLVYLYRVNANPLVENVYRTAFGESLINFLHASFIIAIILYSLAVLSSLIGYFIYVGETNPEEGARQWS